MTQELPFDDEITNTEAFESVLKQLLGATIRNGVDPLGTVVYRGDDSLNIEVLVVELSQNDQADEV